MKIIYLLVLLISLLLVANHYGWALKITNVLFLYAFIFVLGKLLIHEKN